MIKVVSAINFFGNVFVLFDILTIPTRTQLPSAVRTITTRIIYYFYFFLFYYLCYPSLPLPLVGKQFSDLIGWEWCAAWN